MSQPIPFDFRGEAVRVITIDGDPWFVASDVAARLGFINPRQAVSTHVDAEDERTQPVQNLEGLRSVTRPMSVVNTSGVYALIFGSTLSGAKDFKRWVTSEVLPSIQKTGSYSVAKPTDSLEAIRSMVDHLIATRDAVTELGQRTFALEAKVSAAAGEHNEFTTLAYAKLNELPTDRISCQRHGQRASKLMRSRGAEPRKRQDATFGTVNVYPVDVLDETAELI